MPDRRALAGDQLHLDLDLSVDNLPPGTRLALGEAVIEVTARPHNGCAKFSERFGIDAVRWVNSPGGQAPAPPGHQRQGRGAGHRPPGRPGDEGARRRCRAVSAWGIRTFGDPCRECGYRWDLTLDEVLALVAAVPDRYAALLAGADGHERHPDLSWSAVAYVCHVADNLRIWAERLAGLALGADGSGRGLRRERAGSGPSVRPRSRCPVPCGRCASAATDWQAAVRMAAARRRGAGAPRPGRHARARRRPGHRPRRRPPRLGPRPHPRALSGVLGSVVTASVVLGTVDPGPRHQLRREAGGWWQPCREAGPGGTRRSGQGCGRVGGSWHG